MRESKNLLHLILLGTGLLIGIPSCLSAQNATGALRGLIGQAGVPGGGLDSDVFLSWTRTDFPLKEGEPQVGAVRIERGGRFDLSALKAGHYDLCVQHPGRRFINRCLWGNPTRVEIPEGETARQNVQMPTVQLEAGVLLRFVINDAQGILSADGGGRGLLNCGVWLPTGQYVALQPAVDQANQRIYEIAVPAGVSIKGQFEIQGVVITHRPKELEQQLPDVGGSGGFSLPLITGKESTVIYEFDVAEPVQ